MSAGRRRCSRHRPELTLGLLLGVAATLAGCGQAPGSLEPNSSRVSVGRMVVSNGCIAEPIGANPAALYFAAMNQGPDDDALVGVIAEGVDRTDIHRTVERAGISWMEPAPDVTIPAGRSVRFAPGGHHVMLQTSSRRLRRGMRVGVQLIFRRAGIVPVQLPVVTYADLDHLLGQASSRAGRGPS